MEGGVGREKMKKEVREAGGGAREAGWIESERSEEEGVRATVRGKRVG